MLGSPRQPAKFNWQDVFIFLVAAEAGSLRAAGRQLGLNPSTIGRRIARLERAIGERLFEAGAAGEALDRLSPAGQALLPVARAMEANARMIASGGFLKVAKP
ncbi:LysR family transcriptional regulator [Methylobacterium nigriterrae]|uniref:LysR family transcriptional regulator n=1 Tax=Methylobacterium nigriterrae TaxID=3127512 RepID=UPI0030139403